MSATTTLGASRQAIGSLRVLWLVPAVYFLFVASEFVALTHIAFVLTQRGLSAFSVGLVASAFWVGILLASLVAHRVIQAAGFARSFIGACALSLLAVASLGLHDSYPGWVAGVLVLGWAGGVVWVTGESWLAEAAPAERRGFYVGLFETSVGLGMVSGPALMLLAQKLQGSVFGLATGLMAACLLASLALWRTPGGASHQPEGEAAPDASHETGPRAAPQAGPAQPGARASTDWRLVAMPLALVAVLGGLLESGSSALLPGVSLRVGFDVTAAAALGALIGAGSALLQAPFGLLADRIGLRRAMALTWGLLLLATVAFVLGAAHPQQVLWGVGFVLGGVGGAVYTLVVIELGHRLNGPGLVKAMSLLVTAYTGGTTLGPSLGGALFDVAGLLGLACALLLCCCLGAWAGWRATRTTGGHNQAAFLTPRTPP